MAVRSPGVLTIDGVDFDLVRSGDGYAWDRHAKTTLPGQVTPEEQVLASKDQSHTRPLGWLDWSMGIGASVYRPGDTRVHWSEGVNGENPKSLHRGHEVRRVGLTGGRVESFFEVAGALYVVNGDYVRKLTLTLNAETVADVNAAGIGNGDEDGVQITTGGFTDASPLWYDATSNQVFLGSSTTFIFSFDGTTWAQSADAKRTRWAVGFYDDGVRLWGADPPSAASNDVRNLPAGQDPMVQANWTVNLPVGNRSANATAMAALRNSVVVAYDDGTVYRFDSVTGASSPLVAPEAAIPADDAGRGMGVWNGRLVVPLARGLVMYDENDNTQGTFVPIGPDHLRGNKSPVRGTPTALCRTDPEWLYANFYDPIAQDSYVCKARLGGDGEPRVVWEVVAKIDDEKVTALHLSLLGTNPVLLAGTGSPAVHFVTLPRAGRTVFDDGNCRSRITAHSVYLPDHDAMTPTIEETFFRVRVSSQDFSDDEYADVYYRLDQADWVLAGQINESPYDEVVLPVGTQARSLGLRFDMVGTSNEVFPEITGVEADYVSDGEPATWVDCQVFIGQKQLQTSGLDRVGARNRLEFLEYLLTPDVSPSEVVTPVGDTFRVKLDRTVGVRSRMVEHQGQTKEPGYIASFRLNLYDNVLPNDPAIWDVSPYSSGAVQSYYDTSS